MLSQSSDSDYADHYKVQILISCYGWTLDSDLVSYPRVLILISVMNFLTSLKHRFCEEEKNCQVKEKKKE